MTARAVGYRMGALAALCLMMVGLTGARAADPFGKGWDLDASASSLTFQSVKNESKVEFSKFTSIVGEIGPDGTATLQIQLDSVDTGIDLRNVRMRFLFFETFKFPEATVTVRLDPAALTDLAERRRLRLPLEFELTLHGISKTMTTDAAVTLITDDLVSVSSTTPISIATSVFGLDDGVQKLQEAAKVRIVPSGSVSFDFVFARRPDDPAPRPVVTATAPAPAATPAAVPASTAIETTGNFSISECTGRFEILSRAGAIYFRSGSAELDPGSAPFLSSIIDIIDRCPGLYIAVEGHTDAQGSANSNQRLSESRAASVVRHLVRNGVSRSRLNSIGYGEDRPVAANDTARGRQRNRRIEFTVR